ncbi:MAG: AMP-binding protein [Pseudomonadota bacterium]
MNFAHWVLGHAAWRPAAPAIVFKGETLTYAALAGQVVAMAERLARAHGIGPGDRIAYAGLNHPRMLVLLFAAAHLRAVMVPLNTRLAGAEFAAILADADPKICFADIDLLPTITPVAPPGCVMEAATELDVPPAILAPWQRPASPPTDPAETLLIVYTSGTTGRPKGAMLSHRALLTNIMNGVAMYGITDRDVTLTTIPLFHVGGLNIITMPTLHQGGLLHLAERFDVDATFQTIAEVRPSLVTLVPAQMAAMLRAPGWAEADFSSLRLLNTGSSLIPRHLIEAFHAKDVPVSQVYGTTETCPTATCLSPLDAMTQVGSCGRAVPHTEVAVMDADGQPCAPGERGEVVVRGGNVMTGYWRKPEETEAAFIDGWFRTGDIGTVDADGFFWIVDRKKGAIISGGENIYAAEVERVLEDHPDIAAIAVVPAPDPRWGEVPVAFVEPAAGADLTAEGLLARYDGQISRIKWPKAIHIVERLPRNAMGKIVKGDLMALVAEA